MANRVASPTFVGRRRELDNASAVLDRARGGSAAVLLVAGEAGVGKTRFLREVADRARGSGFRVLGGGCVQLGGDGMPFGPIIEAFRDLGDQFSPEAFDELLASGRADLGRLMPGFRQPVEPPRASVADRAGQGRLFEHALLFMRRLGQLGPVALLVEDMHWSDRSTLELLGFLVHNLREAPIAIVASYRSDEIHRRHRLLPLLAQLERGGRAERVELPRFNRHEQADQLAGILGDEPDPELVDAIYARSGGNAFYAEELLAARVSPHRLPDTLRQVLLERVALLSEPTQELVRVASAAGAQIRSSLLTAVTGTQEAALSASLREALAAQILVPGHGDRSSFRHALVQEALYEELLPGERTRLHAAFAEALEDEGEPSPDGSLAAELAYHWRAAHDLPRALDASIRAGMAAEEGYAFADAEAHFEHALELWDRVPDAAARAPLDRIELLVRAADAAEGRAPSRSVAHIRAALDLVDETVDTSRVGLLHERLGEYTSNLVDPDPATIVAAYREAVRLVPPEPPTVARAQVLAGLTKGLLYVRAWTALGPVCEEAIRVAEAAGDGTSASMAWAVRGYMLASTGEFAAGMAALRRACAIAADRGDAGALALASSLTAGTLLQVARYADAAALALQAADDAVRGGLGARFGVGILRHAALALIALGRWDEAESVLDRAQQHYPSHQAVDIEVCLLLLRALRGEFRLATRAAARVEPLRELNIGRRGFIGLAELALWQDDPVGAREALGAALPMTAFERYGSISELGMISCLRLRAEADLAELARASGSEGGLANARAAGADLIASMRSYAAEAAAERPFFSPQADAFLAMCEAERSRLEGSSDPDLWARAAEAWNGLEMPYPRGYALMREGESALGRRDRGRASGALMTARSIAVQLRAEPLLRSVEALATRAGASSTPRARPARRADDLSPRELEVLRLIATGRSDGEIAEGLFITKKTASVHVAHIKTKLGARSRVEIATLAIGQGLADA